MANKNILKVNHDSTGIQAGGNVYIGLSYDDIKQIFFDLFNANFPKLQEVASTEIQNRINFLWQEILIELEKNKNTIDINKFSDPNIQFELAQISTNTARYGNQKNYNLLAKLLTKQLDKNCEDFNEQIAGECLNLVPKLTYNRINLLVLFSICENLCLSKDNNEKDDDLPLIVESDLNKYIDIIKPLENLDIGNISFLQTVNCIRRHSIIIMGYVPNFISSIPKFHKMMSKDILKFCVENKLDNLRLILNLSKKFLSYFELTEIGQFIAGTKILNLDENLKG